MNSRFLYLVPSGGIFELDEVSGHVLDRFRAGSASAEQVVSDLATRGIDAPEVEDTVRELVNLRALSDENGYPNVVQEPPADFPLQTLVMNVTNQCNLSCQYCYEFGEDKVATPEGKTKFMDWETGRESVDF